MVRIGVGGVLYLRRECRKVIEGRRAVNGEKVAA